MVSSVEGPGILARRFAAVCLLFALFGINGAAIAEALALSRPQGSCCSHCKTECHCKRPSVRSYSDGPGWLASDRCEDRCGCRRTLLTLQVAPVLPAPKPAERLAPAPAHALNQEPAASGDSCYPAFLYQRPPPRLVL